MVKIKSIDTIAETDTFRQGYTYTQLWIDPESRSCGVGQESNAPDVAVSPDEWYGRILTVSLGDGSRQISPDGKELRSFLEQEGQAMLDRICDGHDVVWDGDNMIGKPGVDAKKAMDELLSAIDSLPKEEVVTWEVDQWLDNCTASDLKIRKLMNNKQIASIAKEIRSSARQDRVYVEGDIEKYIRNRMKNLTTTKNHPCHT